MLTKTFLLSAAMTTRADAADTSSQLSDLTDRLTATDDHRRIYVDVTGTESLGMPAPEMGGEGQPCYTSSEPCHRGLHCHYYKEGSAWMGKCERDHPHKGGHGEPCRDNGSCNRGLICVRERLLPSGVTYICEEDDTPSPVPPPAPVGEAGGKCGKPPMAPCNHNNLHATNPGHEDCTCEYWLGAEADENRLGASQAGQSREGNPSLGMPAPHMGGEGEPCRNTNGLLGATECNFGLKCHYTTDGSAIFGTCRSEFTPAPRPEMGGLLEPCRDWNSPFGPCNPGLYCDYYTHHGDAVYGTCRLEGPSPTPRPVPQPRPSNQRGGLNERCYNDGTCNAGLNPTYYDLPGQALCYPVCNCRSNGHRLGATAGDDSSTKLGMPAQLLGREGEPCRSRNDPEGECDYGFTCHYTTDGSAIFGTCQRDFEFLARDGEKGGVSAERGQSEVCELERWCKAERKLGCSYEPCTTHIRTPWERRGSNLVVPGKLGEGNDASQDAESADDNISSRFRPIRGKLASGQLPTAILSKSPTQNRGKTRTTTRPKAAKSSGCQHHKWAERASLAETPTVTSVTTVSSVITLLTGSPFSAPVNETSHFSPDRGEMWISAGWAIGDGNAPAQLLFLELITATRSTQAKSRSS